MNRRSLGALAIVIILLMVIVATAGLDNLPRGIRSSIKAAATQSEADRAKLAQDRDYINRALVDEPALFRTKQVDYHERLKKDTACLASAASEVDRMQGKRCLFSAA